jgi:hypothetical protein
VCKVNVETGKNEPDRNRETNGSIRINEEELISFAQMLVKERQARLQKKASNTSH